MVCAVQVANAIRLLQIWRGVNTRVVVSMIAAGAMCSNHVSCVRAQQLQLFVLSDRVFAL